ESKRQTFVRTVADAHTEMDPAAQGRGEIHRAEETGVVSRQRVFRLSDVEASSHQRPLDRVHDQGVLEGEPGVRGRRSVKPLQLFAADLARTAVRDEGGRCHDYSSDAEKDRCADSTMESAGRQLRGRKEAAQ